VSRPPITTGPAGQLLGLVVTTSEEGIEVREFKQVDGTNYRGHRCKRRQLIVTCDGDCESSFTGPDIHAYEEFARLAGWVSQRDGKDYCPACVRQSLASREEPPRKPVQGELF
jgi:hypothetical protein